MLNFVKKIKILTFEAKKWFFGPFKTATSWRSNTIYIIQITLKINTINKVGSRATVSEAIVQK